MENYKRKKLNIGVKREFQRWLLLRILGAVVFSALVAALVLYFYSRKELGDSFYTAHITVRRVSDLLLPVILAGSAVSLISGLLIALFLPQKIAGPLYHVEEDFRRVGEGDLTVKIVLREGDPLQDFAAVVNSSIAELQGRVAEVQLGLKDVEQGALSDTQQYACQQLAKFKV
ncbi:MAG: methyl-accepting chemotaxis protein [Proteobacteria bacterium]|nr:methyl-accepting chemotaxis protein [Pseudomonadota bacterium]MBU1640431.1 methyl-accepting chemotaxis protein [Pseudomonadota bacterium]